MTATSTPGYFRINALSPALTDPNAVMTVTIQYADMDDPSPTYQGRPAAMSEPTTMTPAVANLVASAVSTSEIDLTWTLNAPNASAIEVDRSTDGINWTSVTNSLSGTATSYADATGLSEASHYYYRVRAVQPGGPSAYTNSADTWTLASAPGNLTVKAVGADEIDLSWSSAAGGVTGFHIQRSEDGGTTYEDLGVVDAGTTTYQDQDITEGTTYTYQISAITDGGEGAFSSASSASAGPLAPADLTANAVSDTQIDLNWDDPSDFSTGYIIERADDSGNFTQVGSATDTSSQDTGLTPDTQYTYYVVSNSASGTLSNPSDTQSATTDPAPINVILGGDSTVGRGDTYTLELGYQVLDGGTSIDYPTSVNIDWGDGQSDPLNEADPSDTHTYDTRGVYTINVTATAPAGTFSSKSKVIVGINPISMGFNIDLSQSQFDVHGMVRFTASLAGDALDLLHVSKWAVDWNDGSGPQDSTPSGSDPTDQTFSHNYQYGGTTYDVAITAVTDQGLITGDEYVTVKAPADDPNYPTQSQVNILPTGGNGGNGGNNGSNNGTTSAVNQGFTIDPCAGVVLDYPWIIGWGDGNQSSSSTSGSFTHPYPNGGQYYVTVSSGGQVVAGKWVNVTSNYIPTVSPVPDQTVSTGDPVNISATAGEIYYNSDYEGYVDWGDGTGLHPTNYQLAVPNSALSAKLDAAGDPGQYAAALYLYGVNEPNNHSGMVSGRSFKINVSSFSLNVADLPDASQPSPNQMDPGVFIPINDNYDSGEDVPDDQLPVPEADDPQLVDASMTLSGASGAQATWSLNFPSSIEVFQVRQDGTLTPVTSGQASDPVTLEPDGTDVPLLLEGISAAADILIKATMTPVSGQVMAAPATDQAKAQSDHFGINAYTVSVDTSNAGNPKNVAGAELDTKKEAATGAFVPVNNDDDAYKISPTGNLVPDMNVNDAQGKLAAIPGEDDLLPIVIHLGANTPKSVELGFTGNLRVWQNADRSGQIMPFTPLTLPAGGGDLNLFVEAKGTGIQNIRLIDGTTKKGTRASLKITPFSWTGPLNVPQYGTYQYTQQTAAVKGKWIDPVSGIATDAGQKNVAIQWGTGGQVGAAVYQASADFTWGLEANIVKIDVTGPKNPFTPGVINDGGIGSGIYGTPPRQLSNKLVTSQRPGIDPPGMQWQATVKLTGASHGNNDAHPNRGVDFMNIGFVQNATIDSFRGTYTQPDTPNPGKVTLAATNVEGQTIWDTIDRGTPDKRTKQIPYSRNGLDNGTYMDRRYDLRSAALFDDANSANQASLTGTIKSSDAPYSGPPVGTFPYTRDSWPLTSTKLLWNFTVYVTATTTDKVINTAAPLNPSPDDPRNPPKKSGQVDPTTVYAAQAFGTWRFDGNGKITDTKNPKLPWVGDSDAGLSSANNQWQPATADTTKNINIGPNPSLRMNPILRTWTELGWAPVGG